MEIPEILKDDNNVLEYTNFIKKSSKHHNVNEIIEIDLFDESQWSSINQEFYTDGQIASIASFGTKETFESHRKSIISNLL